MTYDNNPSWTVEVSFTPIFAPTSWVDISQYVQSFTTTMGKQHERDEVEASKAEIVLDNRAATFNPWNTQGPYYGLGGVGLVPMLPCRITATWPPGGGGIPTVITNVTARGVPLTLNTSTGTSASVVTSAQSATGGTLSLNVGANPDGSGTVTAATAAGGTLTLDLDTGGGETYPIFYGYIDSWIPSWQNPLDTDLTIEATDILGVFAQMDMNSTFYSTTLLNATLPAGPAAWYRLGDAVDNATPGVVLLDSSGVNATVGTIQGGPASPEVPIVFNGDGAFNLDATTSAAFSGNSTTQTAGDYVQLSSTIGNSTSWSVELWMMSTGLDVPSVGSAGLGLINWESNGVSQLYDLTLVNYAGLTPGPQLQLDVDPLGAATPFGYTNNLCDGNWHQIVITGSPTTEQLYVDTVLIDSVSGTLPPPLAANPQIGYSVNTTSTINVQDVSFWNVVLTASQILDHYDAGTITENVQPSGERIGAVCEAKGIEMSSLATGISEIQPTTSTLVGTKTLSYMQQVNDTENGLLFQAPDGVFTFYDRHYILTSTLANTSQATFEDAPTSTYFYLIDTFTPGLDNLDLWNEVQVSAQATGASVNPSGALQLYENTASQAQYGQRTYPSLTGLLMTTDSEALECAQWIGTHYSTPLARVRSIRMNNAPNGGVNLPQMLGRGLWDRITVIHHGLQGGSAFQQDSIIEGISHNVTPSTWTTTLALSPAETQDYMILNSSVSGHLDTARLAY